MCVCSSYDMLPALKSENTYLFVTNPSSEMIESSTEPSVFYIMFIVGNYCQQTSLSRSDNTLAMKYETTIVNLW